MSVWALVGQGSDSVKGDSTDATGCLVGVGTRS